MIEVLVEHFSNYTKVYSEAHEQDVYIRFYDPRAINKYFMMLDQEEGLEFFSKVDIIYVEQDDKKEILYKYNINEEQQRIQLEMIKLNKEKEV